MCVYSAARLPPANASKHTVIIQCLFSILVTWYVNMFWYWQCISTECASLPLSACLKGFHLAYTMAHICFVCGTLTMHTDVIWQHWNICSISALARLFGSTCPGTCTLDTVGAISVLFSLLTSVYMCVCVCFCVCVCVCINPGEVDDVLDSICFVHDGRDGHRPAAVVVSQEMLVIMTLLSLLVINELLI